MMLSFSKFLSTFFYLGKIKYAPGTIASLATLILWYLFSPSDITLRFYLLTVIVVLAYVSTYYSLALFKEKDPQCIVIDEVLGMSIPLVILPNDLILFVVSFLFFRFFDILKPSIIYYAQNLDGVYGVLMDDILAGLITLFIVINYL